MNYLMLCVSSCLLPEGDFMRKRQLSWTPLEESVGHSLLIERSENVSSLSFEKHPVFLQGLFHLQAPAFALKKKPARNPSPFSQPRELAVVRLMQHSTMCCDFAVPSSIGAFDRGCLIRSRSTGCKQAGLVPNLQSAAAFCRRC